ncbi:unnamed protein product, partial [Adineta steineri]
LIVLSTIAFKNVRRIRAIPRQERRQLRTMNKKDFQLLRASGCYSATLHMETLTLMEQTINTFLTNFGSVLHDIPYCTNFITFICVSKVFRLEVKRLIFKMVRKDLTTVREEENIRQEVVKDNIEPNHAISTINIKA